MVRATCGAARHRKKLRYFKQARGYRGGRSRLWRTVQETLLRAQAYAFADRRRKKRDFRKLWILRINAAARMRGLTYSQLMNGLQRAGIEVNRKQLSELAIHDPLAFDRLCTESQAARG
jgi:large subunit ribosomal protein L20